MILRTAPLIALVVVLLAARLLNPPARLIDIGGPGDAYLAANFYQPERAASLTFRWSGPNSLLQLSHPASQAVLLSARLHGQTAGQPLYLQAPSASTSLATLIAEPDWRVYHVLLPPPTPAEAPRTLQLVTALVQPGASDPRELGVALDWVRLQPLPGVGALLPTLGQALLFGWALALLAAALWIAQRTWAPATPLVAHGWRILALLGVVAGGLLWWAWQDPYALLWLLPLQAGPLAMVTVITAGLVWAVWGPEPLRWPGRLPRGEVSWPLMVLALAHLVLWSPLPPAWRGGAALLILWMPGWLLARRWTAGQTDGAARLLLGICGALGLQVVLLLAGALLPLGLAPWALLLTCTLLALCGAALLWRAPAAPGPTPGTGPRVGMLLALVLVLAAGLRLPALGSAELHDDEASVFIAATRLVQGDGEVLLTQLKGPAQILLAAGPLALTGQLSELVARLPFALAGLGVVVGGFVLARGMAGSATAGLIAALILALDGFMIAFSRIVQYQSFVVLLVMGAIWCAWRFYEDLSRSQELLTGAAILLAAALLGHYDAIFAAPALLWLVLAGGRRRQWRRAQWARALGWPTLAAGALLASFYVPFALHPHVAEVVAHLSERTGQNRNGWALYNNLASSYGLLSFYNLAGMIQLLTLLLVAGLAGALAQLPGAPWRRALGLLALAGLCVGFVSAPGRELMLSPSPAAVALLALPVAALLVAPATPVALRSLLIWSAAGGMATMFLIAQPRTHIYVFTVPLALLAGWSGAGLLAWLRRSRARSLGLPLAGAALALGLLALLHQATLYVRQSPEYQRTYPAAALAPLAAGATLAAGAPIDVDARFGFPSRDGWKVIGELYRRGVLRGPYASNQSTEILIWYLRGLQRCNATPDYVFVALSAPNPALPAAYTRIGSVQVAGQDQIAIYGRLPQGPARVFALEDYVGDFDAQPIPPLLPADVVCAGQA